MAGAIVLSRSREGEEGVSVGVSITVNLELVEEAELSGVVLNAVVDGGS